MRRPLKQRVPVPAPPSANTLMRCVTSLGFRILIRKMRITPGDLPSLEYGEAQRKTRTRVCHWQCSGQLSSFSDGEGILPQALPSSQPRHCSPDISPVAWRTSGSPFVHAASFTCPSNSHVSLGLSSAFFGFWSELSPRTASLSHIHAWHPCLCSKPQL